MTPHDTGLAILLAIGITCLAVCAAGWVSERRDRDRARKEV
jgi:hypothetical protein